MLNRIDHKTKCYIGNFSCFAGDVKCFKDDCYPLAFGVPALLMIMAILLFWCGRHKYKRVPLTGNIIWQVLKAMNYALKQKITTKGRTMGREGKNDYFCFLSPSPLFHLSAWCPPTWSHFLLSPMSLFIAVNTLCHALKYACSAGCIFSNHSCLKCFLSSSLSPSQSSSLYHHHLSLFNIY